MAHRKRAAVFKRVYESYFGDGGSVYRDAAYWYKY